MLSAGSRLPLLALALPLLLALVALCASPLPAHGAHSFDAYRLVQYDRGTTPLGSRRTLLNQAAATVAAPDAASSEADWAEALEDSDEYDLTTAKAATQDLHRKVVVLRISALTPAGMRSIVSRGAIGVVIVVPKDVATVDAAQLEKFRLLERFLAERTWDAAVYFAHDDEYLSSMLASLSATLNGEVVASDAFQIAVNSADVTAPLTGVTSSNMHGWLHAASSVNTDSDTLPTIAVVASFDSISSAPGLAKGVNQNGSGAVALLELVRIFSRLYSDFRTHGSSNLLFLLTSADRLNFGATKSWLRNIDSRVLESVEFALCLERIASKPINNASSPLYLHVSKLAKTPEIQNIYANFKRTAAEQSIPFEIVHKKINISNPTVFWQHEQFSRKRIVAATLSSEREADGALWGGAGSSLFDGVHSVDFDVLERNIRFVVEALGKQIYRLQGADAKEPPVEVLAAGAINRPFLEAYTQFFASTPRFAAFLSEAKTNPLLLALESHLTKFSVDFKKQTFSIDQLATGSGALKFYRDAAGGVDAANARFGVVEMHAFQVKPFSFDIYLALATALYLLAVYIACQSPTSITDVRVILIGK